MIEYIYYFLLPILSLLTFVFIIFGIKSILSHRSTINLTIGQKPKVSITRLPITGEYLFGREEELEQIDAAWNDTSKNIVIIVAWGGVGKSALVNHWLGRVANDNYREADKVFAWSFSGQGKGESNASSDEFFAKAFDFFDYTNPQSTMPIEKGRRLAKLVRNGRTLLILDGLEPLQSSKDGSLNEEMQVLIRELAAQNSGLCIITTRQPIKEIGGFQHQTVLLMDLKSLTKEAGVELLINYGVKGLEDDLGEVSKLLDGHALSLNLLGTYLRDIYNGDLRHCNELKLLTNDYEEFDQFKKVIASYEDWLGEGAELNILRLMGLFERVATAKEIATLRAKPAITGLTDTIVNLSDAEWNRALSRLRKAQLIFKENENEPGALDTHPLIRQYFSDALFKKNRKSWVDGHQKLYEHLKGFTEIPDNSKEMMPLFSAVYHGCNAEKHVETFREVLLPKILQFDEGNLPRFFSTNYLGLWDATLAALSLYFKIPWKEVLDDFKDVEKAFIYTSVGVCLRTSYHFREAIEAIESGLSLLESSRDWKRASVALKMLNQIYIYMGKLQEARKCGEKCIEYAEKGKYLEEEVYGRARYGESLHHAGEFEKAEDQFKMAEEKSNNRLLGGFSEFEYCSLLLTINKISEAVQRANGIIKREENRKESKEYQRLWEGLGYLILVRIKLLEAYQCNNYDLSKQKLLDERANDCMEKAMKLIEESNERQHLPLGFLVRSELNCELQKLEAAEDDLKKVMEISSTYGMLLHKADCNLGYVRYYIACNKKEKEINKKEYNKEEAQKHLNIANDLVIKIGYNKRKNYIKELSGGIEKML